MASPTPSTSEVTTSNPTPPSKAAGLGGGALGTLAIVLSVIALILGGAGLGLAVSSHGGTGPAGSTGATGATGSPGSSGATGPQGPPGARGANGVNGTAGVGTILANSTAFPFISFNATNNCMNFSAPSVTITVPAPGTVAVRADFVAGWGHSSGVADVIEVWVSNTTSCGGPSWYGHVSPNDAVGGYQQSGSWERSYPVGAGVHTFYLVAWVVIGSDSVEFWEVDLTAVFYPA